MFIPICPRDINLIRWFLYILIKYTCFGKKCKFLRRGGGGSNDFKLKFSTWKKVRNETIFHQH